MGGSTRNPWLLRRVWERGDAFDIVEEVGKMIFANRYAVVVRWSLGMCRFDSPAAGFA